MQVFINLKEGYMGVGEYSLKFTKLSKYALFMIADLRSRMSKFFFGVLELVTKECKTSMLVKELDIFYLMTYAEQIKEEKLRESAKVSKRDQVEGGGFSH